jgi:uncharacterized membrane protein YjjB (DUF3815 family)
MAMRSSSAAPVRKVAVSGLAGAITTVVIWILNEWVLKDHQISGQIGAAITTILTVVIGYLIPPGDQEQNVPA